MATIDPLLNGSPLYLLTALALWLSRGLYRRLNSLIAHCSVAQVRRSEGRGLGGVRSVHRRLQASRRPRSTFQHQLVRPPPG